MLTAFAIQCQTCPFDFLKIVNLRNYKSTGNTPCQCSEHQQGSIGCTNAWHSAQCSMDRALRTACVIMLGWMKNVVASETKTTDARINNHICMHKYFYICIFMLT